MASPQWMFETDLPDDVISNSLRFNQGDSPHLELASLSGGSNTKGTVSFWCKRGVLSDDMRMWSNYAGSGTDRNQIGFLAADTLTVQIGDTAMRTTNRVFRDVTNWYHIVVAFDSEQSTANDRIKVYVNGVQETSFGTTNNPSEDAEIFINNDKIYWGRRETSSLYFDGYLAECIQIDGSQLTPTSFGKEVDNVWIPIDTSGLTFGTNGYRLQYLQTGTSQNASGIGADTSGNTKHFAVTNLAASDVVIDTPENTFCTMSPLVRNPGKGVFTEGNLQTTSSGSPAAQSFGATFAVSSGKWYWEGYINTTGTITPYMAVVSFNSGSNKDLNGNANTLEGDSSATDKYVSYGQTGVRNGSHGYNNVLTTNITTIAQGQVIGFALDMVSKELKIYNNGVAQFSGNNVADSGDLVGFVMPAVSNYTDDKITMNFGQDDTFAGALSSNSVTGGGGKFRYAPPAGFNALSSRNLDEPAFSANPNRPENVDDNFEAFTYTGNSDSTRTISGFNFQADLMWNKARNQTFSHRIYDSTRGNDKGIFSNNTSVESTHDVFNGFTSDGFNTTTDGSAGDLLNYNGGTYVVWNWKGNAGTTSSNDSGDITTTVQVNTKAGFSIITYTGSGTDGNTIGHGLNQQPDFIIGTPRDSSGSNRVVWHKEISLGTFLKLNLTDAVATSDQFVSVSDTLIGVGGNANLSGKAQVIWCWHEVAGYSKFGSYTGNGNDNGPYIHLGFRPKLFVAKRTDSTNDWQVMDSSRNPTNVMDGLLFWNLSNSDTSDAAYNRDFLSNGVKIRGSESYVNASGGTFVYMAWAEMPEKYSNAF